MARYFKQVVRTIMAIDLQQVAAAILTTSMFLMFGNMVKKDHIDPLIAVNVPVSFRVQHNVYNRVARLSGPWKDEEIEPMSLCWKKFSKNQEAETNGFVSFSLTNEPEYHALQISNAVFIAKHLGSALVLPNIKGVKVGMERAFDEIYDVEQFTTSFGDIVQVVTNNSSHQQTRKNINNIVKIPTRVTKEFISANIEPLFRKTKLVRLESHSHSLPLTKAHAKSDFLNPYTCLAMFRSLKLQLELQELVETMVRTLQFMSLKSSGGKFIAIDLRVEDFKTNKNCSSNVTTSEQSCFGVQEIGQWLKKIGFGRDTTLYITQTQWHKSLQPLKEYFPNIFTKDSLLSTDLKAMYLNFENFSYEKFFDFYLCARSNVFVPTSLNLFYASVVGLRIASGNTQILVPPGRFLASSVKYLSPYVLNKNHMAYSCFC